MIQELSRAGILAVTLILRNFKKVASNYSHFVSVPRSSLNWQRPFLYLFENRHALSYRNTSCCLFDNGYGIVRQRADSTMAGDAWQMKHVLVFPPKDGFKKYVSLLSEKGKESLHMTNSSQYLASQPNTSACD